MAKRSVDAGNTQVDAIQKVEAALASTGGVSRQTSEGLQAMAARLQEITTHGDEAILAMQAVLLTFTNIRGARFEQATTAILNMASALGTDLKSAALQVGKAFNDPVRGVSALAKAGIQFTDQQRAQIRAMVEAGDVATCARRDVPRQHPPLGEQDWIPGRYLPSGSVDRNAPRERSVSVFPPAEIASIRPPFRSPSALGTDSRCSPPPRRHSMSYCRLRSAVRSGGFSGAGRDWR